MLELIFVVLALITVAAGTMYYCKTINLMGNELQKLWSNMSALTKHFENFNKSLDQTRSSQVAAESVQKGQSDRINAIHGRLAEIEMTLTALSFSPPLTQPSAKAPPANRKARTPEQRKRASEIAKARWAKKKATDLPLPEASQNMPS